MKFLYRVMLLTTAVCWAIAGWGVYIASAAPTTNVLGGGVTINEILIDPNGVANFDTDGNGTAADQDEFVELYNLSASAIDISGWQLWDRGSGNWFTFPGAVSSNTTVLQPNAYAVVVGGVQTGGTLPTMTNPNSLAFDAGRGGGVMNNGGDDVVLYDPVNNEYIQLVYNGDAIDDPVAGYTGFSASATRIGSVEDWGNDVDGKSITRYPSGDTVIGVHDVIVPGGANASPTAVTLTQQQQTTPTTASTTLWLTAGLLTLTTAFLLRRRTI